eukprot:CFRG7434T1
MMEVEQTNTTIFTRIGNLPAVASVCELTSEYYSTAKVTNELFSRAASYTESAIFTTTKHAKPYITPYLQNEHVTAVNKLLVSKFDALVEYYPIMKTPLNDIILKVKVMVEYAVAMLKANASATSETAELPEVEVSETPVKNNTELPTQGATSEEESILDAQSVDSNSNVKSGNVSPIATFDRRSSNNSNASLKHRANSLILNIPRHGVLI